MSEREKVLVIGGAGYAGARLIPALLNNFDVKILDTFWYGKELFAKLQSDQALDLVACDIRQMKAVSGHLKGVDIVIYLACISNDPSFDLDPKLGRSINLAAFEPIVKLSKQAGVKRFVYASSSSVYGVKQELRVTEDLKLEPLTDYSRFKADCESILLSQTDNNFIGTILRPATLCGFSERQRFDLVVNILTNHAFNEGKIRIFGGEQFRPNLHIEDMVDSYIHIIKQPIEKVRNEIFNVSGSNLTVNEIAEIVSKVTGVTNFEHYATNDPRSYRVDSSKIEIQLGFKPKRNVKDAVEDLLKAFELRLFYRPLDNPLYFNVKRMRDLKIS